MALMILATLSALISLGTVREALASLKVVLLVRTPTPFESHCWSWLDPYLLPNESVRMVWIYSFGSNIPFRFA